MRKCVFRIEHVIPSLSTHIRVRLKIYAPAFAMATYSQRDIPRLYVSFPAPDGENRKTLEKAIDRRFFPHLIRIQDGRAHLEEDLDRLMFTTSLFDWLQRKGWARIELKEYPRIPGEFPLYINARGWRILYNMGSLLLSGIRGLILRKKTSGEEDRLETKKDASVS